jgi:hypothetical protein
VVVTQRAHRLLQGVACDLDALAARLADHLSRYAELGVSDSWTALEDEVYGLMQSASIDWGRTSAADSKTAD